MESSPEGVNREGIGGVILEAQFAAQYGRLGTGTNVKLAEDVHYVALNRFLGDVEFLADLAVGPTGDYEFQDFTLARGEALGLARESLDPIRNRTS